MLGKYEHKDVLQHHGYLPSLHAEPGECELSAALRGVALCALQLTSHAPLGLRLNILQEKLVLSVPNTLLLVSEMYTTWALDAACL